MRTTQNSEKPAPRIVLDRPPVIMDDNEMKAGPAISAQLRERRKALGLSLSEVARRAGTSAATLSRYEHGWTRFETYTLRKLAAALGCVLDINLRPRSVPTRTAVTPKVAAAQLKRLFWDHALMPEDLKDRPVWVVERVLEYGQLDDVTTLIHAMGRKSFLKTAADAHRVSPRTRNFWCQLLKIEGIPCTRKYSRNTAWNS